MLGAGSWGTTVASLVARNTPVSLWARNSEIAREINASRTNERYLPGAVLAARNLRAYSSMEEALKNASLVVVAVPSQGVRRVLQAATDFFPNTPVISLTKGLEKESGLRMTQVIDQVLPGHPTGILTGPNLASEIISGMAAAAVLAIDDNDLSEPLAEVFRTKRFRVYTNTDVVGCELSGAFKNVIALACGMADGIGAGDNTRAAFITRGLAEITRLGMAMGGEASSFSGLAGLGDLITTCTSNKSRNHYVGEQLGKGRPLDDVMGDMRMVVEGVTTTRIMLTLGEKYSVDLPIARQVESVLSGTYKAYQAFVDYLRHRPGSEDEPG